jgi:AhpD family alkylhydroperoxidase
MARIQPASTDRGDLPQLDAGQRAQADLRSITAHRPEIAAAFAAVVEAINRSGTLPRRLIELIRLRIAFHNQCRICMSMRYSDAIHDGLTEGMVCSLEKPADAEDLSAAERAALRFADLFATDHLSIDDAVYDDLRQYFTEGELVEIGYNCAVDVGLGRITATWDVTDHLPEGFRRPYDERVTPWDNQPAIIR